MNILVYLASEYKHKTNSTETLEELLSQMDPTTSEHCLEKGIPAEMSKDYFQKIMKSTSFAKKASKMLEKTPDIQYEKVLNQWFEIPRREYGKLLMGTINAV